jgi:hypothetical protein
MLITEDSGEPELFAQVLFVAYPKSSSKAKQATALIVEWPTEEPPTSPQISNVRQRPTSLSRALMTPTPVLCLLVRLEV